MDEYVKKPIAPGVRRVDLYWGYWLFGKKEALIAAGLAKPHWFASGKKKDRRGRTVRLKQLETGGRKITTVMEQKGRGFSMRVELPKGEEREEFRPHPIPLPPDFFAPQSVKAARAAQYDAQFQRFMSRILPNQPGAQ